MTIAELQTVSEAIAERAEAKIQRRETDAHIFVTVGGDWRKRQAVGEWTRSECILCGLVLEPLGVRS